MNSISLRESAEASVIPISPLVRKNREPPDVVNEVMGVDDDEEEVEEGEERKKGEGIRKSKEGNSFQVPTSGVSGSKFKGGKSRRWRQICWRGGK